MENAKFFAGGFLYNPKTKSVLLHLRDDKAPVHPNKWGFFGGSSEGSETPKQCFTREVKEELGINLMEENILPVCDYLNEKRGTWRHVFYVKSDLDKSKMTLGEGADFDWVPLDEVFDYDLTDKTRQDLEFFLKLNPQTLNA
ncbi:MAG: NUDIX domain-containing protein [Candidatus Doudnabacteria bacterium]|nr:NUDIX domain-containing protein [Candidatus Doudnabacteria bacterium]